MRRPTLAARGRRIKLLFTAPNFLKHFLDFWEKTLSNDNAVRQSVRERVFTRTLLRYVRVFAIANPSVVCRLSSVCLSVTLVNPTQGVEAFAIISYRCVPGPSSDLSANIYGDRRRETPPSGR